MADEGKLQCPHCETLLSRKSYEAHKRLYYDGDANDWIKKRRLTSDDEHLLISQTEEAIEQFDFDAFGPDEILTEMEFDDRPPLVDFDLEDDRSQEASLDDGSCTISTDYSGLVEQADSNPGMYCMLQF